MHLRIPGLLCFVWMLAAQTTGGVRGTIVDNSGAVIPAAVVSLAGSEVRKTASGGDGTYAFAGLTPGSYTLTVAYPGFGTFERTVIIEAGKTAELPVQLLVTAEKQRVTVEATPGPSVSVEPDNNATAMVLKSNDLDALPDNPDDLNDALQMLAGPAAGPNGGELFVDGFSGGKLPPKSSIREIRINQNPFSAEYDRLGMGRIEILTKPGSEKYRGELSVDDSDGFFNSRNPYSQVKADYVNRWLEGNFGGPINHRSSFFIDFEKNTQRRDALIHAVTLDPASLSPSPLETQAVSPSSSYEINPRIDIQLAKNHTLTARYDYEQDSRDNNGVGQYSLVSRAYPTDHTGHWLSLSETAVLSAQAVNDFRLGYSRETSNRFGDNRPAIIVTDSFTDGGSQVGRAYNRSGRLEIANNTSIGHKTHTVRFGMRLRRRSVSDNSPANFGGAFTFFGVDGADGQISSLEQYRRTLVYQGLGYGPAEIRALGGGASQFTIAGGNPLAAISIFDAGVYVQDDWRARPNLTISYGLRYENQTGIGDPRDFAPRLGVAWAPGKASKGGARKTVLRWGFGAYYDRVQQNLFLDALRFNGVNQQQFVVSNPDFFPNVPSLDSLSAQRQALSTYQLDSRLRAPLQLQTVFSIERQLPAKTTLAATYTNGHSTHVLRTAAINAPMPGSGLRPYPDAGNVFQYESNGVMNMNMFTMSVNTRFSSKVTLSGLYGYMRASSDVDNVGLSSNPYDFKQDYGRASFERRNRAQVIGSYLAPGKVRISPLLNIFGAAPYNLIIGRDLNGDTVSNERPAFATDLSRASVVRTPFGAFDTDPIPGQRIVPRNYLAGDPMINLIVRVGRTFEIKRARGAKGPAKTDEGFGYTPSASLVRTAPAGGSGGGEGRHYTLNFNLSCNNPLNHLNKGGWVGNLSSPLFGQSTAIYLQRDTSNNRVLYFGTTFSF